MSTFNMIIGLFIIAIFLLIIKSYFRNDLEINNFNSLSMYFYKKHPDLFDTYQIDKQNILNSTMSIIVMAKETYNNLPDEYYDDKKYTDRQILNNLIYHIKKFPIIEGANYLKSN